MTKQKKILLGVLLCVLALAAVYHFTRPAAVDGTKHITVEVIHKDGGTATFSYTTEEGFLGRLLEDEGLVAGTTGPYGLYIDTVDGETAVYTDDGGWWQLLCDGEAAVTGVDSVPITDGAVYTLAYTIS